MSAPAPAGLAAIEGWYTLEEKPHLLGTRCSACGTCYFPKQTMFCRNPQCEGTQFEEVRLSRTGRIWSYTDACYEPPAPYVAAKPFIPFVIAAVELAAEKMIVLGQVARGVELAQLRVGMAVELVLEPLYTDERGEHLVWKWRPLKDAA
ncbi:MAG: OB-fold domain-containing protein [Proteobacteria bacterium]|nr:OB-fold domain-containing protein [Pseudomonadota bacterium]